VRNLEQKKICTAKYQVGLVLFAPLLWNYKYRRHFLFSGSL
jgi:hypothetical protein